VAQGTSRWCGACLPQFGHTQVPTDAPPGWPRPYRHRPRGGAVSVSSPRARAASASPASEKTQGNTWMPLAARCRSRKHVIAPQTTTSTPSSRSQRICWRAFVAPSLTRSAEPTFPSLTSTTRNVWPQSKRGETRVPNMGTATFILSCSSPSYCIKRANWIEVMAKRHVITVVDMTYEYSEKAEDAAGRAVALHVCNHGMQCDCIVQCGLVSRL